MPTISVIIPAYNAERTILETIDSVRNQTFDDFELIVINDGSTDQTVALLSTVADHRLKVFSYSNGGLPTARNRGVENAQGEFIAFLDADDLWASNKLELQLTALQQHPEAGVAYSWTYYMDEQGKTFDTCPPTYFEGNVYANLLVADFIYSGSNTLIRRAAIKSVGKFDPELKSCEDWDYWLRLAACWPFVVVPQYQIFYRRALGAMSSKIEVMKTNALTALEKAYQMAPPEFQGLKTQSMISFYQYCADLYLRYSTTMTGVSQAGWSLWMALRLNPKVVLDKNFQSLFKWLIKKFVLQMLPLRS